jgi:hypothetical protein
MELRNVLHMGEVLDVLNPIVVGEQQIEVINVKNTEEELDVLNQIVK